MVIYPVDKAIQLLNKVHDRCLIDQLTSYLHTTSEIAECFLLFCFSVFVSRFIDPSDYLRGNQVYEA